MCIREKEIFIIFYKNSYVASMFKRVNSEKNFFDQYDLGMSKVIWKTGKTTLNISNVLQPAHVKACFLGSSLSIPITDGKLALGTWQGIWLGEHRDHAGSRKLVVTLTGVLRDSARSPLSPVSPIASTSS